MHTTYKISDTLFLQRKTLETKKVATPVEVPTNHLVVIDCSGSMYSELPKIREQLKKKLPKLIGAKDTLSIIWFSGKGEFGTLLEAEPVSTLKDLADVNRAIDRWLKPIGLTGFKEPLDEVANVIERIKRKNKGVFSLFLLTDGCDNQWPRAEILKAVEKAAGYLASATFVEYGYYADRPMLTAMAEKAGGQLIFADNFDKYQPVFEAIMAKKLSGAPKVEVKIPCEVEGEFVYALTEDEELTTYAVEDGSIKVATDSGTIWYLTRKATDSKPIPEGDVPILSALYAAMSLFAVRMKPDIVYSILKCLADVSFIDRFSTCFGKQQYSAFMEAAKKAAFDKSLWGREGYDPNKVPADDAYTILDLLKLLASDDSSRLLLDHPDFKYSKIGRGRVDADEILTEEEQSKVAEITAKMASEKNAKKIKVLQEELAAITAAKKDSLKFEADPAPDGYSISNLTYNEDRPNISLLVRKEGTVDLSSRSPAAGIPTKFPTFIFRNYAVLKDGLVNIEKLPIRVSKKMGDRLSKLLPKAAKPTNVTVTKDSVEGLIDLRGLPVINRKMVKEVSAKVLFEKQFELETVRAAQKVYKAYRDEKFAKKESASFKTLYGEEGAAWLKEQGFTDYSGFSPKQVQAESTDYYLSKELVISIKGLSSLPKVSDVKTKIASGKLTTSMAIMAPFITEVEAYLALPTYTEKDFKTWIDSKAKEAIAKARDLIYELSCIKFSILIGQTWFKEFSSLEENSLTLDLGGQKGLLCKVLLKESPVKI